MTQQNKSKGQSGRRPMSKEDGARVNVAIRSAVGRVARTSGDADGQPGTLEDGKNALSDLIRLVVNRNRWIATDPTLDGEAV